MKKGFKQIRLHVNPLRSSYQIPLNLSSNWIYETFQFPFNSFIIDIGCAEGIWPIKYAEINSNKNIIGIDIRPKIIQLANENKLKKEINNILFLSTNANINLIKILQDINKISKVELITIQFPDPYFKSRYHKRRLINYELIQTILLNTHLGTKIFIQSDYKEIMEEIINVFNLFPQLTPSEGFFLKTLDSNINPFQIQTERERSYSVKGLPIYRMLYEKTSEIQLENSNSQNNSDNSNSNSDNNKELIF